MKTEKTEYSTNIYLGPGPGLEVVAKAIEVLGFKTSQKQFFENRKLHAQLYRPLTPDKLPKMVSNENEVIKPTQAQDDGNVKSVVESLNKGTKDPIFKNQPPNLIQKTEKTQAPIPIYQVLEPPLWQDTRKT